MVHIGRFGRKVIRTGRTQNIPYNVVRQLRILEKIQHMPDTAAGRKALRFFILFFPGYFTIFLKMDHGCNPTVVQVY